jgi:two-component system chemotaxis sensor kinase CheA
MDDFSKFIATFITECKELLEDMEERLMDLNEENADSETLNAIFRCAHSIKGGAGAFGFNLIANFTHVLEALLDNMREGKIAPTRPIVDKLLEAVDILNQMVKAAEDGTNLPEDFGQDLAGDLAAIAKGEGVTIEATDNPGTKASDEAQNTSGGDDITFYSISFIPDEDMLLTGNEPYLIFTELKSLGDVEIKAKYDKLPDIYELEPSNCYLEFSADVNSTADMARVKEVFEFVEDNCKLSIDITGGCSSAENVAAQVQKNTVAPMLQQGGKEGDAKKADANPSQEAKKVGSIASIRVDVEKIDALVNLVGEIVINQAMIQAQTKELPYEQYAELIQGIEDLSLYTRELQEAVMSVRMQPVKSIFSRMPRLVRDVSKQLHKDIRIDMLGEGTEIDKTIIEQLSDPLTHMIRNSLDHGIEKPEARVAAGKPAQGVITLEADQRGGKIVITIEDDGNGVNREKVLAKAIEKGIVNQNDQLSPADIDRLIFHPGFSTADQVSDISGRGVGMDVVKKNIENIGGAVEVESTPGKGSKMSVFIPLTLAILDGMVVGIGDEKYIIPISNIIETLRPKREEVKKIADGNDVINVRGEFTPVLYLHRIFNVNTTKQNPEDGLVVLVEAGIQKYGLLVDELLGQQQVVVKSLEENAIAVDGVSGATILGDGKVSLILDMVKLQSLAQQQDKAKRAA